MEVEPDHQLQVQMPDIISDDVAMIFDTPSTDDQPIYSFLKEHGF